MTQICLSNNHIYFHINLVYHYNWNVYNRVNDEQVQWYDEADAEDAIEVDGSSRSYF